MEHRRPVGVGEVDRVELDVAFAADQIQRLGESRIVGCSSSTS